MTETEHGSRSLRTEADDRRAPAASLFTHGRDGVEGNHAVFSSELAAESITVRIRWFGLAVGYLLVNAVGRDTNQPELNAILALGAVYAAIDTWWSSRGRVFLSDVPLVVSVMEAVFIGLLCYFDRGLDSPFRFYYFLSLLVCAIRHAPSVTFATFVLHSISYVLLTVKAGIDGPDDWVVVGLILTFMGWVTWAITALTGLIKTAGHRLSQLNAELQLNQAMLEQRIQERTRELQESQAVLVQQEKQAAFGLLAAGIAHEVGNPLASISAIVQMLNRRNIDSYTRERLQMVDDQMRRIQRTLHELVDFSRPATSAAALFDIQHAIEEALSIAKYYKRKKGKRIVTIYANGVPPLRLVRDQLVQVILNLVLNAMDATDEGAIIEISTHASPATVDVTPPADGAEPSTGSGIEAVCVIIRDFGHGIPLSQQDTVFEPYFTTKSTGTGLGLFVCRHIMEQLGGRIELTESSPAGTVFTLHLKSDQFPPEAVATTSVREQQLTDIPVEKSIGMAGQ